MESATPAAIVVANDPPALSPAPATTPAPAQYPSGTAPVKAEYLIPTYRPQPDDDQAEGNTTGDRTQHRDARDQPDSRGPSRGKQTKEQKKAQRGQNKARRFGKVRDDFDLCWRVATGSVCEFGAECRFAHDIPAYLTSKPVDIHMPLVSSLTSTPPFAPEQSTLLTLHPSYPTIDTSTMCPVFEETGECRYGYKCRFLGGHVQFTEAQSAAVNGEGEAEVKNGEECVTGKEGVELVVNEEKKALAAISSKEVNFVGADVQKLLRSRKYKFPIADEYLRQLAAENPELNNNKPKAVPTANSIVIGEPEQELEDVVMAAPDAAPTPAAAVEQTEAPVPATAPAVVSEKIVVEQIEATPATIAGVEEPKPKATVEDMIIEKRTGDAETATKQADMPDVRVRFLEKKRLHWKGKSYLAPLTTVGNLPFRRLCVDLGADITCGEMGLASSFLAGSKEEWSLVRRHPSEKIFGVQVAGNKPANLVPTAEVLAKEFGSNLDFVDVNCGCPIDLVFKSGSGSALLDSVGKLGKIVVGMNKALGEIPVTVKLRTGVKDGKNTAHKLMPRLSTEWNAGCITLHGRSRQQRYTRLADWDYIKYCVEAVRAKEADEDLPPVPIFGGGDCFSSQDYWEHVESTGVDGIMVARGALIKPWIFTEIKEKREWDISAIERLELIRKYAEYGLNHFGSDTTGVNTTRRYLCEALSFHYRYVPIGILERLPGRINDRAPAFRGRNELESLLSSPDSSDWVKISEMFLGPAPETWSFTPKHKSNAYGSEEGQG